MSPSIKESSINLNSSLDSLRKWMKLLGVPMPPVTGSFSPFSQFIRFFFFTLILLIQLWAIIHTSLNAKNVSVSYANGISTAASSWNFIIDSINFAMHIIGGHVFMLFLTQPKTWENLTNSLKILEDQDTVDIYQKCRQFTFHAIAYVISSVRF